MDLQLKNKFALVTGSTSGIGEGIAKALAQEGAAVVVNGRNATEAKRVVHEIQSAGAQAAMTLGDLTTDDGASHVAQEALLAFDRIDILINNAGAFPGRGWTNATPDQWLELYNLNVVSRVRLIQQLIPQMKRLGWRGFQPEVTITDDRQFLRIFSSSCLLTLSSGQRSPTNFWMQEMQL